MIRNVGPIGCDLMVEKDEQKVRCVISINLLDIEIWGEGGVEPGGLSSPAARRARRPVAPGGPSSPASVGASRGESSCKYYSSTRCNSSSRDEHATRNGCRSRSGARLVFGTRLHPGQL